METIKVFKDKELIHIYNSYKPSHWEGPKSRWHKVIIVSEIGNEIILRLPTKYIIEITSGIKK